MNPMSTAPRDCPIIVEDEEGIRAQVEWDDACPYDAVDGTTAYGCWRSEGGWIAPYEAKGWVPDLSGAIRVHGG